MHLLVTSPGMLTHDTDDDRTSQNTIKVSNPANDTLILNAAGSFTYTPTNNFKGTDSFAYKANDGQLDSNVATVTIAVNAVNVAPAAVNDSYTVAGNSTLTVPAPGVLANDTDVDNDPLTAVLVSNPSSGMLVFNQDGSFIYTPNIIAGGA